MRSQCCNAEMGATGQWGTSPAARFGPCVVQGTCRPNPAAVTTHSQAKPTVMCYFAFGLWYSMSCHIPRKCTRTFSQEHICLQKQTPLQSLNQPQTLLHMEKHSGTVASKGEQEENKAAIEAPPHQTLMEWDIVVSISSHLLFLQFIYEI